ncbi:MAG: hypothetical protein LBQ79_12070, partial [Deltaproteobacteria bacterium]|nr:hypothetical protein [Deltaproteobacteria bacterium]
MRSRTRPRKSRFRDLPGSFRPFVTALVLSLSLSLPLALALSLALDGCSSGPPAASAAPPDAEPGVSGSDQESAAVEPLEILQFLPAGDVRSFTQAAVMFSQPMAEPGTFDLADQSLLKIDPPMAGKVVWINQFTLAFVPEKILLGSLSATVTLSPDIRSLSGAGLAPVTYSTAFRLPELSVKRSREFGGRGVEGALRPAVTATFNQPVDPGSVNGRSFFRWGPDGSRAMVPAVWAENPGRTGGGIRPLKAVAAEDLPRAVRWSLVIGKGAVPGEGLAPLESDLEVASGETYGDLRVTFSGFRHQDGPDAANFMAHPELGYLNIGFTNPVRLSDAADFIEMLPPHPDFAVQKANWLRIAASRADAGTVAGKVDPADADPGGERDRADADPAGDRDLAEAGTSSEAAVGASGGTDGVREAAAGASGGTDGAREEALQDTTVQNGLWLWGDFIPETDYSLVFRKGMRDVYGQTLAEDAAVSFRTGAFEPSVRLASRGGVLESAFPAEVPVEIRNLTLAPLFGKVMSDAEAAVLLEAWDYAPAYGLTEWVPGAMGDWVEEVRGGLGGAAAMGLKPSGDSSRAAVTRRVSLSEMFGGREKDGVIFLGAGAGGQRDTGEWRDSFSIFQVTGLAITVKAGRDESLAWVTGLSDGRGVGGAAVSALDCAGTAVWSGETGPDGLARLPGARELAGAGSPDCPRMPRSLPALHFTAAKGGERVFWSLRWGSGFDMDGMKIRDFRDPISEGWKEAFLVSSQPVYRPGETARLKIIARNFSGDDVTVPLPGRVRLILMDPLGRAALDVPAETGEYGTASLEWPIPEGAPYGEWKVVVDFDPDECREAEWLAHPRRESDYAGAGTFRTGFFRTPAFGLELGRTEDAFAGDRVELSAVASYHFGAPLVGGEAEFELRQEPLWDFAPPGFGSGWAFTARRALERDAEGGWASDPAPPGTAAGGRAATDGEGRAVFAVEIPRDGPPVPRHFTLTVSARDRDSRPVSRAGSFTAHPAGLYAGIRTEGFVGEEGKPMKVSLVVTRPDGTAVPGEAVKVSLYRRSWTQVRRLSAGGSWDRVSGFDDVLVSSLEIPSGAEPVTVGLTPVQAGFHFAVAEVKDPAGRAAMASCDFFAAGAGASWPTADDVSVELSADRSGYRPGDTARILVKSPFESGTGLFTVERGGVREARTFDLAGGAPVLEYLVSEDDAPSVYVSVVLARGRSAPPPGDPGEADLGRPGFRRGYLVLRVLPERDRLRVEVTPAEAVAAPGGEASVRVRVTDSSGAPFTDGEVALAVVDAGLVQTGGDGAFRPEALLWKDLPLSVRSATSMSGVLDARDGSRKGGPAPAPGGGGGIGAAEGTETRRDFRSVAHFEPGLKPDANGEVWSSFTLPDNLTAFRIFAVATGRGREAGTGEGGITVTRDLVLRASLPGHLTAGDEFAASAVVTSRAAGGGELRVAVRPLGGMELLDDPVKTVTVRPGESVEVSFGARAVPDGPGSGPG